MRTRSSWNCSPATLRSRARTFPKRFESGKASWVSARTTRSAFFSRTSRTNTFAWVRRSAPPSRSTSSFSRCSLKARSRRSSSWPLSGSSVKRTNEQLQEKAKQLSEQMEQVEYKNREVEHAKAALEEKAEQLALSSRYKSEFLANMSHELRTPLNSLLILAKLLADNAGDNLTPKQID